MALEARPDLALVDIGLPGLDGYRLAQELRARVGEEIRRVAVTGNGGPRAGTARSRRASTTTSSSP